MRNEIRLLHGDSGFRCLFCNSEKRREAGCRRSIGCAQACSTLHEWRGSPPIGRSASTPKKFGRYRLKAEKFSQAIAATGPKSFKVISEYQLAGLSTRRALLSLISCSSLGPGSPNLEM